MASERLLAHWALQVPAAVASALVLPQEDDSHANFGWSDHHRAFLSHQLSTASELRRLQIGLRPTDLSVILVEGGETTAELSLVGRTLSTSLAAVREALQPMVRGDLMATPLRDYDMPRHPVGEGAPFATGDAGSTEPIADLFSTFARTFAAVEEKLRDTLGSDGGERSVAAARIWPHHFDLGGLVTIRTDGEDRWVGYGMSPGDETFALPYLYVSPYPAPEVAPQVATRLGHWNTGTLSGFVAHGADLAQKSDQQLEEEIGLLVLELASSPSVSK